MLERIQKNWWLLLLRGILALILGILAVTSTGMVLVTFLLYIGIMAILNWHDFLS